LAIALITPESMLEKIALPINAKTLCSPLFPLADNQRLPDSANETSNWT
jgi:hypothetical protein